ncbi:helicase domain-containing protein (plasmid) [Haliscomenobacter hydrossis DSM 1100]|uniref:Helicase domain-containing protein n=1 Tax=Haliscomenobacter hydrossis (strain ATCC 27775 / DSM 1100 / LMG 10767 / O) TaxID=760192 RepID=F4L7W8_HALH1|nr:helicase domain-containing protein [Haliscomenobacter hydrossis DSM 1100]
MEQEIQHTLNGLKDFQLETVKYVFEQLYVKGQSKMLIADEVGLGKTIVAKGIIAKAFSQFVPSRSKKVFNVVYICSNQALASQNLKKLNFSGKDQAIDYSESDDRLTALAYLSTKEQQEFPLRIKAFTPATSFDDKTHAGKADERVLLYRLLYLYSDFIPLRNSLKWILKGNRKIKDENWMALINAAEDFDKGKITTLNKIRPKVDSAFRQALNEKVDPDQLPKSFHAAGITYSVKYWTLLRNLCRLNINKDNYRSYDFYKELVSTLRFLLSRVCLEYLQADIFILDEFQRYKQLIDKTGGGEDETELSPHIQLARDIFSFEDSKILMLSATPFKPYTNDFDELNGEDHYNEFVTVLKFLRADKPADFWTKYELDRKALFAYLRHPDTLNLKVSEGASLKKEEALNLKTELEGFYRTCMVRTEKLLASKDRDAMIQYVNKPISIQPEDIYDFVVLDQITQLLNKSHKASLPVPLEYVKSCPFALSFLDNYKHKEKIRNFILKDSELQQLMKRTKQGWVNLKDIKEYKPLIPRRGKSLPNAKLRLLLEETVHNNGWKYLWIPPSIPYYELSGAYKDSWGYSKTLIFSSWKLVPRMVATLVSYEAERLSIGNPKSISEKEKEGKESFKSYYFQKRRSPRPQFTFKAPKEEDPKGMNSFILSYPCLYLANLYDPVMNIIDKKSIRQIKKEIKNLLIAKFQDLNLNQYVTGEGDWNKWHWLAPLLLDKYSKDKQVIAEWLGKGMPKSTLSINTEDLNPDHDEMNGKMRHFNHATEVFQDSKLISAAKLNSSQLDSICEHLAELTIGSPAICYMRSQWRYKDLYEHLLDAAFNVSSAFLAMFNKPESIAVVRLHTEEGDYWERVLQYMIDGNLQAMLDEFVYLLINGENFQSATELSNFISDILSVRTTNMEVEDYPLFISNLKSGQPVKKSIRTHYAIDFGTQRINTARGAGRQINVRQAFNSPFRPFVLASTSIGQEGLDFHLYCKKIFHWNLPSNPIDFEQREGRIHRYQGLVIRLNLASKYQDQMVYHLKTDNIWQDLLKYAEKEKKEADFQCDLVPFWHTETTNGIKIERFVPLYPFSKDIERFNNLIKILTFYRLTFGQPRQSELVDALHESGFSDEEIKKLDDLMINLSPITFKCP